MRSGISILFCFVALTFTAVGLDKSADCKTLSYENRNQVDYGPLRMAIIGGTAEDSQRVPIPDVCVGVFTEVDHKLVAVVSTDQRGRFELKGIPEGTYRLVVKYEGFSPANAKVRIEHSRRNKLLTVQMRPTGLDSGSVVIQK